jgi:L-rhamnose isomerase/sugar isomerase
MLARELMLDIQALNKARRDGDVLTAHQIFMDAFYTDVRRDLADLGEERGLPADPMAAYLAVGFQEQIEADRIGGAQSGWN